MSGSPKVFHLSLLLAAAVLAGPGAPSRAQDAAPPAAVPPPSEASGAVALPPPLSAPAQSPLPQALPPDQCGARDLANLVGRPRTQIPVAVDMSRRRVVCTTCPRTQEYDPSRVTIEYDAGTGRVSSVKCG